MNRKEMLAKLKAIKPTACPVVMTMDMGLQIEIMNAKGATTNMCTFVEWPLWSIPRLTDEQLNELKEKIKNKTLVAEDFPETLEPIVKEINSRRNDVMLAEAFKDILNYPITETEKEFFIYCNVLPWTFELCFYGTKAEAEKEFFEGFEIENVWEEMEDTELEEYCALLDEQGEGIPFNTYDENNAD